MAVDYHSYGRWTFATYNIFKYNAQGGGDELYGVEPIMYYIKNAALNFNYLAILALLVLPVCMIRRICGHPLPTPFITLTGSLYMWLAMVVPRPHKEERFLFPIYAIVCLSAVVVVEQVCLTVMGPTRRPYWMMLLIPSSLLGMSRTMALSRYYTSPLAVYASIPSTARGLVCTCGEWYRFPSSFMLPNDTRLAFVKSSFTGQLPKQFQSTRIGTNFNDANTEEMDRYVLLSECAYVVELEGPDASSSSSCTMQMMDDAERWTKVASYPFLDAAQTSSLHRVLYIPYLHERSKAVHYHSYSLYQQN
jgi:alpha-1,2-mannosyltransferase